MARELHEDEYRILLKVIFRLSNGLDELFTGSETMDVGFDLKITTSFTGGCKYWAFEAPTWAAHIHNGDLVEVTDPEQFARDLVAIRLVTS